MFWVGSRKSAADPTCFKSARNTFSEELLHLEQAVLEHAALIQSIAMGPILGDTDRAWIEAEDVRVVWCRLVDLLVRVSIDKG